MEKEVEKSEGRFHSEDRFRDGIEDEWRERLKLIDRSNLHAIFATIRGISCLKIGVSPIDHRRGLGHDFPIPYQ